MKRIKVGEQWVRVPDEYLLAERCYVGKELHTAFDRSTGVEREHYRHLVLSKRYEFLRRYEREGKLTYLPSS